jgi:hypothetical protein
MALTVYSYKVPRMPQFRAVCAKRLAGLAGRAGAKRGKGRKKPKTTNEPGEPPLSNVISR